MLTCLWASRDMFSRACVQHVQTRLPGWLGRAHLVHTPVDSVCLPCSMPPPPFSRIWLWDSGRVWRKVGRGWGWRKSGVQKKKCFNEFFWKGTGRKSGYGLSFQFCPVLQQKKVFFKNIFSSSALLSSSHQTASPSHMTVTTDINSVISTITRKVMTITTSLHPPPAVTTSPPSSRCWAVSAHFGTSPEKNNTHRWIKFFTCSCAVGVPDNRMINVFRNVSASSSPWSLPASRSFRWRPWPLHCLTCTRPSSSHGSTCFLLLLLLFKVKLFCYLEFLRGLYVSLLVIFQQFNSPHNKCQRSNSKRGFMHKNTKTCLQKLRKINMNVHALCKRAH